MSPTMDSVDTLEEARRIADQYREGNCASAAVAFHSCCAFHKQREEVVQSPSPDVRSLLFTLLASTEEPVLEAALQTAQLFAQDQGDHAQYLLEGDIVTTICNLLSSVAGTAGSDTACPSSMASGTKGLSSTSPLSATQQVKAARAREVRYLGDLAGLVYWLCQIPPAKEALLLSDVPGLLTAALSVSPPVSESASKLVAYAQHSLSASRISLNDVGASIADTGAGLAASSRTLQSRLRQSIRSGASYGSSSSVTCLQGLSDSQRQMDMADLSASQSIRSRSRHMAPSSVSFVEEQAELERSRGRERERERAGLRRSECTSSGVGGTEMTDADTTIPDTREGERLELAVDDLSSEFVDPQDILSP
ncbi:hypothetical protein KIPB_007227 [Kipferlia bialata]|uniref:Uncharacterized protein n=1 Tax=Kipferlia bialata TaxID=797122 RepID=A0A9K3GIK7_9EUKA|nr:hypothetical protein KIPB_004791 [Kipferlia bialata]GIQ83516.1 hypothetical protein KIPB_004856 [Kipferlia bialata]GIQ85541.1 hypothetical protein KIPB_007227 [Kipferlia bialata]|eukprot:g4791.t1